MSHQIRFTPESGHGSAELGQGKMVPLPPALPSGATAPLIWFGLNGPAGTPRPIIDKLADAAPKAMQTPKAQEALRKQGFEPVNGGPDEFAKTARWSDVAQAAG